MKDTLVRWGASILVCVVAFLIKTFGGSDAYCRFLGYHRWDVHASGYNPQTKEPTVVETVCVECGEYRYFDSWQAFAQEAVREIRQHGRS